MLDPAKGTTRGQHATPKQAETPNPGDASFTLGTYAHLLDDGVGDALDLDPELEGQGRTLGSGSSKDRLGRTTPQSRNGIIIACREFKSLLGH